jgi:hypothetical protein
VPRPDERMLAERLDRVLDGRERPDGELVALASVLERAAAPARIEVSEEEVERALGVVRPKVRRPARLPRLRPALGGLALAGAVAAVLAVVLTRGSPLHVEGRALAALGGQSSILRVIERVEPTKPGTFPPAVRVGWIDAQGARMRWDEYVRGRLAAKTLLEHGRVSRYLVADRVVFVATSCTAFASGCAELVDPLEVYRRALEQGTAHTSRTTYANRPALVLVLPIQTLPDALRIEQRVTIDASTYLPLVIQWIERPVGGEPRSFSRTIVKRVREIPPAGAAQAFQLDATGVRVVQRVAPGRGLRKLSERGLSRAQAAAVLPGLLWLGPANFGQPYTAIDEIRWNAGTAYRIRYGRQLTVWNYDRLVPPVIASSRYTPAKIIPLPDGRIGRFYVSRYGQVVLEVEGANRSIALIGPQFGKESFFEAIRHIRPLR